jgi:hypothetical protein
MSEFIKQNDNNCCCLFDVIEDTVSSRDITYFVMNGGDYFPILHTVEEATELFASVITSLTKRVNSRYELEFTIMDIRDFRKRKYDAEMEFIVNIKYDFECHTI